ncbi:hypothetical protein GGS21DRAFT_400077 [Xylaria nigripes]|nr:hypothetical protein GGS21DRAFT_400077 [Xylaria nigripes]
MAPRQREQPSRVGRSLPRPVDDTTQPRQTLQVVLPRRPPPGEYLRLSPVSDGASDAEQESGSNFEVDAEDESAFEDTENVEESSGSDDAEYSEGSFESAVSRPRQHRLPSRPSANTTARTRRQPEQPSDHADDSDESEQSSENEVRPPPRQRRVPARAQTTVARNQSAESSDDTDGADSAPQTTATRSLRQTTLPWGSGPPKKSAPPRATPRAPRRQPTRSSDRPTDLESSQGALRLDLAPITNVHQAFQDMLSKRQSDIMEIADNGGLQLRVATICSGTEAPVFALKLIKDLAESLTGGKKFLQYEHLFSVENEPFKQAYISRNAPNSIVFRDVVDFADTEATAAPTILGDHREIPRDIDLLVAGTSCVDFSTLNNGKRDCMSIRKKGAKLAEKWKRSKTPLGDDFFEEVHDWLIGITPAEIQTAGKSIGESSLTFLSTVCYMDRHRPKLAIFENVNGAPWSSICGFFLRAIGYVATHCAVDTKDYYIPQTRQRGYAVAVDGKVFGSSSQRIVDEWKTQLASLKRGASSPVQDWLLPSNDPLTIKARQDESEKAVVSGLNPGKDSQWERSKLRHNRVRRQFNLGNSRPLTGWGLSGIQRPYDRIDRLVLKGQNDRALDCVEIYYLRSLLAGPESGGRLSLPPGPAQCDIKFKSQIFDLSQNIDRSQLSRNFGITGCLTPRGLNLITNEGRLVSGFEALNLQGLPLRDLDLTRESQDELRDLAGNAMTTTVVGASLFSLLVSVKLHDKKIKPSPLDTITTQTQTVLPYEPLYRADFPDPKAVKIAIRTLGSVSNVQQVMKLSRRSRRYCYCDGGAKYSTAELLHCQVCGVIRCTSCAGNPAHRFGAPQYLEQPIMNDTVPQEMMKYFPTALTNILGAAVDHIPFRRDFEDTELQNVLLSSLQKSTFYYTKVMISDTVTICYMAKDADCCFRLQAVISDTCITWYLFLDPWSPCGQQLCKRLKMPAARMLRPFGRVRIYAQDAELMPDQGTWEFWVFTPVSFNVNVTKINATSIKIENISLEDLPTATHDNLRSISGIYDHHPECDAAEDSLHVCVQPPKRYLFKDPTKIGMTQEDCFVISDECRYLEKHEFRDFSVNFSPDWTPQKTGPRARVTLKGYWEKFTRSSSNSNFSRYIDQAGSVSIPPSPLLHVNRQGHNIRTLASVRISSNMLDDLYMTLSKYQRVGPEHWAIVSRSDYSALFDLLAPVNIKLSGIETTVHINQAGICQSCCPNLPDVHWMEKEAEDAKKNARVREPYRLSSEMRLYEQQLRLCGEPFQVAVNIRASKKGKEWKQVTANYEANFDLLVHRAVSYLPRLSDEPEDIDGISTFVNVERGSLNIPNLRFESFRTSLQRLPGKCSVNGTDFSKLFIDGYALSNQQQVSLNWMLGRERSPLPFTEREIEECRSDPLNLRILGIAERDVVRLGGILADDVGYGKTVVSLALMAAQESFDQGESLRARASNTQNTMPLAASLVIVPKHLVNQWRDEAAKFIGWKNADVLIINSSDDLQDLLNRVGTSEESSEPRPKKTKFSSDSTTLLDKLRAAKLIILNTSVFDDHYYAWLGRYAGSLAPPQAIPRSNGSGTRSAPNPNILGAFQDWYEDATEHARMHLSGYDPAIFNPSQIKTIQERQQDLQKTWETVVADYYDGSTRLGLQAIREDKTGLIDKAKRDVTVTREYKRDARVDILRPVDFKSGKSIYVLEAFSFARVIYDEFSYENYCVAQFVRNADAHAKWILSATPPTGNLRAVCDIGRLLKVHVARPVKLRPGLPLITEGPIVLRQSSTEKQLAYQKLYTDKSVYERVDQGHKFLKHFASANPFDEEGLGKIKVTERVYCSHLTRYEFAKYLDIQRDLQNSNLDISNLLSRHNLDSEAMSDFPPEGKLRAGLALAYVASVNSESSYATIDELLASRRQELEVAKRKLRQITSIAIWLVMRRYEENTAKKNDSATNIVEDFVYDFQSILEANPEAFGGIEGLNAVTESIFDEVQFEGALAWLRRAGKGEMDLEAFFTDLFGRLDQRALGDALVSYFQLSEDNIKRLGIPEVVDLLDKLSHEDTKKLTDQKARLYLEELIQDRQSSSDLQEGRLKEAKNPPTYPRFGAVKRTRGANYTEIESELTDAMLKYVEAKEDVTARAKQVTSAANIFSQGNARKCSACERPSSNLLFLPECGHFICPDHREATHCGQIKSEKHPKGTGCSAVIRGRAISVKQIDRCSMNTATKGSPTVSSKTWNIFRTIQSIIDSSDDKVLVFYQFDEQATELCDLLEHHDIPFESKSTRSGGSAAASEMDSDVGSEDRIRILKLSSEEAAGSNFQDANHVLFLSTPVFGKQEDFERYVKQAKGRAVRHGQQKEVFVYYFVSINTFEVDLLQLRKRSNILLQTEEIAMFVPKQGIHAPKHGRYDSDGDVLMNDRATASGEEFTSGLSDEEVWRLTDETNWLVQQNREF